MRFAPALLLLAAPCALATDVAAQSNSNDSVPVIHAYATCMARHHYRELAGALDSGFDQFFATALASVPNDKCDGGSVAEVPAADLRGALFAAMYRRFGPRAGSSASNIASEDGWVPMLPEGDARIGWYFVSNCLARLEPDATRSLARAAGTDAAAKYMQDIVEALPGCLPAGQQFRVTPVVLTGLIAETVYQIDFATQYGEPKHPWGAF